MRFKSLDSIKSLTIGKLKEKLEGDAVGAGETSTVQIADMGEQINNRTKDLEETEQQLKELADIAKASEENEEAQPQPHGPLSELSIETEDQLEGLDDEIDTETIVEEAGEAIKVVEVGAGATARAEAVTVKELTKEDEKEEEKEEEKQEEPEGDSLNNLFSQDEQEENPQANLINSLPEVTARELLDDLQEINEIIREGQHN